MKNQKKQKLIDVLNELIDNNQDLFVEKNV